MRAFVSTRRELIRRGRYYDDASLLRAFSLFTDCYWLCFVVGPAAMTVTCAGVHCELDGVHCVHVPVACL